jgi:hypothetical protein
MDTTGEPCLSVMVASISHDDKGLVTCLDEHRHGLEDGRLTGLLFELLIFRAQLNVPLFLVIALLVFYFFRFLFFSGWTGDHVTFTEIEGMAALNSAGPLKIKTNGPYSFFIGDTRQYGEYKGKGVATQFKMPAKLKFVSRPSPPTLVLLLYHLIRLLIFFSATLSFSPIRPTLSYPTLGMSLFSIFCYFLKNLLYWNSPLPPYPHSLTARLAFAQRIP